MPVAAALPEFVAGGSLGGAAGDARNGGGSGRAGGSVDARQRVMRVPLALAGLRAGGREPPPSFRPQENRMKAMTQDRYGSADVLTLGDIAVPAVGDDEVLIRVRAAGVGPDVWHLMTGRPYFVRLMGIGLRKPKTRVVGRDVAGSVEAVGKDVTQFRLGDEVFGTCRG